MNTTQLSERFKNFAKLECRGSSELYEYLSVKISEDEELLELCMNSREGQPVPNLLLGAVHYLLLKGEEHVLKEYYPSITNNPREIEDSFVYFKDFCQVYKAEIISLLKSKLVQTNEVRRCAYLYPIFCYIYSVAKKPLSFIEIGTSAGLQLLWDKYSYSYGTNEVFGDRNSDVHITSEIKGDGAPPFLLTSPPVASKVGLDLHISDLNNFEDYLWLKALIWPEHEERLALFDKASTCFIENPVKLVEGDGVALLTEVAENLPEDTAICIFHTHVANQIPEESKYELIEKIKTIGSKRDVFHLYNNMWDRKLHLDYFLNGIEYNQTVGETDGHGRWFEWNLK
ncbi:DUF2332 domain-containing protein [Bacillus cytotoxicus]|uniref:DUF2332 domain-containing protein n=1 Tax=Bacillus cytotoxicus TaxID=580165 RepID=A0ACC6A9U2_9BACI|nr:DUF2332 domain-containing protein [Bacillus cytotoxicus]